jgi:hypothetical protein
MHDILTSGRAIAVLDNIGWPKRVSRTSLRDVYTDYVAACIIAEHLRAWLAERGAAVVPMPKEGFAVRRDDGIEVQWLTADGACETIGLHGAQNFATDHEALLAGVEAVLNKVN